MSKNDPELRQKAQQLGLWGLLENWDDVKEEPWLSTLLRYEDKARARRSLERRVRNAKLGRFKPMADFDWKWPKEIDRELIEEVFELDFLGKIVDHREGKCWGDEMGFVFLLTILPIFLCKFLFVFKIGHEP